MQHLNPCCKNATPVTTTTLTYMILPKYIMSTKYWPAVSIRMTTVFITPGMTKSDIYEKMDTSTRFVIMEDHYPLSPYSPVGSEQFVYDLFEQFPNCTFVTSVWRPDSYDNEIWFPFFFIQTIKDHSQWMPNLESTRPKTANVIGGQTRISRTLLSFWLKDWIPHLLWVVYGAKRCLVEGMQVL